MEREHHKYKYHWCAEYICYVQVSCEEEYLDLGLPALDTPPSSGEQLTTQLQFRPLHFSNQHYDSAHTNTNWSPDQVTVYMC